MQPMRRKERQITRLEEMKRVVDECTAVRLAIPDGDYPYVVPVNFGYEWEDGKLILYFHSAQQGRKATLLRHNGNVGFEMDSEGRLTGDVSGMPCALSWHYVSIIGCGQAELLTEREEKARALNRIVQHATRTTNDYTFPEAALDRIDVWKVVSLELSGKENLG